MTLRCERSVISRSDAEGERQAAGDGGEGEAGVGAERTKGPGR